MITKISTAGVALALALAAIAMPATAKPTMLDPDKVSALAGQISSGLAAAGCGASSADDKATIESIIGSSSATPAEAAAALNQAKGSPGVCPNAKTAINAVHHTIELAIQDAAHAGPGGGPGGSAPIGAPPAYASGGGSNYINH